MTIIHDATDATTTVRTTIDVAADPERVFDALIDPDELAAWWGSDESYRTHDWTVDARPGGAWRAETVDAETVDADGRAGSIDGTFTVVDRPRVLESTWRTSWDGAAPNDDDSSTVRYELDAIDVGGEPGTRLTVTHTSARTTARAHTARARRFAEHVAFTIYAYA